jgi:hypothetical protein
MWKGVTDGWGKLHNEELQHFYSSIFKSIKIRWTQRVARMGEIRNIKFWSNNLEVSDNLRDLGSTGGLYLNVG